MHRVRPFELVPGHGPAGPVTARNARDARLLVVVPLAVEYVAVRRGLAGARVLRCGMGPARARAAASLAARIPADALAVAGFCGAVAPGLRAGDLVVAGEVRGPAGAVACHSEPVVAALASVGLERVHVGPVASVDHVVHGAERGALAREGVLAVDMESAWLAPAAAGRPFAVLRVVLDTGSSEAGAPWAAVCAAAHAWLALRRAAPALVSWSRAGGGGGASSRRTLDVGGSATPPV